MTTVVGVMVYLQSYVLTWMIPIYAKTVAAAAPAAAPVAAAPASAGMNYLIGTFVLALAITLFSLATGKKVMNTAGNDAIHFH